MRIDGNAVSFPDKARELNSLLLQRKCLNPEEVAEEMEGNFSLLTCVWILAINCPIGAGRKKAGCRNRRWRSVLTATYVLTFNGETIWKMRAAAEFIKTKPPFGIVGTGPRTNNR
jgi:hypothetical protein